MSVATAQVDIVAPAVPGAASGTVIGAAEVLDRSSRRLERVPLRTEIPTPVGVPHEEQCLVRGWSPYLSVQPIVVTGGRTQQAVLYARRANGKSSDVEEPPRPANGWIRLWGRSRTAGGP